MANKVSNGVFYGRTLVSTDKKKGGARHVFVPIGGITNQLVFPPFGGRLMNPFPGAAKLYAGDLFYLKYDDNAEHPEYYALKTYEVYSASGTTINIVRDGFRHIPFVGDVLTVAPDEIGGTGAALTVTAVKKGKVDSQDVWVVTTSAAAAGATKGTILVECDADGAMLVKDINGVAPYDYDFQYDPAADPEDDDDFDNARYLLTPVLGGRMYTNRMSPLPECVKKLNTAKINGWFEVGGINGFL